MTPRTARWEPFSQRVGVLRGWLHPNGRWPSAVSRNEDERRLGRWVQTQRNRHRDGLLATDVAAILGSIPGWTWGSGITGPNSTRGNRGLQELRCWMSTHPDMPRYIGGDREERSLATWSPGSAGATGTGPYRPSASPPWRAFLVELALP